MNYCRPFSLDNFSDYEKHFTVMNYQNPSELKQIHYDDFIGLFEQQYPNYKWSNIQVCVVYMFTFLAGYLLVMVSPLHNVFDRVCVYVHVIILGKSV